MVKNNGNSGNYISFNRDLNRGCLVCMFSLRFSGSKFLINLRRQFRIHIIFFVRKIFRTQVFTELTAVSFCVFQSEAKVEQIIAIITTHSVSC